MKAIVNRPVVSMHGTPDKDTSLVDEVLYGMIVTVDEFLPDRWCRITTEYRYQGYTTLDELLLLNEQIPDWDNVHKMRIHQSYADILSEPRVQGVRLMEIPRGGLIGVQMPVIIQNGWVKVRLADGRSGYMKETFLEEIRTINAMSEDEIRSNVIETAKSYLGTQYRWGGKSPLGIDCSGLTSISYLINGILTYRDASIEDGFPVKKIAFSDRKPGDLLYFKGHIAMLTDLNRYIHSTGRTGSDGVVMNSLDPADADYREDLANGLLAVGSVFPLKG